MTSKRTASGDPRGPTDAGEWPGAAARSAAELWLAVSDALVRGIGHTLSNRVTSLGALGTMMDPGDRWDERLGAAFADEMSRFEEVIRLARLIPRERPARPEPIHLAEVLRDAIALHELHPELRDVRCELDVDPAVQPVWGVRSALVHGALVLLEGAKRAARARGSDQIVVRVGGDARRVEVAVAPGDPRSGGATTDSGADTSPPMDAALLRELVAHPALEGPLAPEAAYADGRYLLRLPALAAVRERERSAP